MSTDTTPKTGEGDWRLFGPWLKAERLARGMTQVELADATFVGQETISKVEGGRQKPSMDFCMDVARVFERPIDEVMLKAGLITSDDVKVYPRRNKAAVNGVAQKLLGLPEDQLQLAVALCHAVIDIVVREGVLAERVEARELKELRARASEADALQKKLEDTSKAFDSLQKTVQEYIAVSKEVNELNRQRTRPFSFPADEPPADAPKADDDPEGKG